MASVLNIILVGILIGCSAFFAGTETGVYRLSRVRLRIGCEKNKPSYKVLFNLIKEGEGLIVSLLLGNNLVNYGATSIVTLMFLERTQNPHEAEIFATAVMTPLIFIFGEIIPKNIFYYKADGLLPRMSKMIWVIDRLFTVCGAKWLLRSLSRILSFCLGLRVDTAKAMDVTQRHQVRQIIHETREEGMLSETQKEMMSRLMDIPTVPVDAIMVGLERAEKIGLHITREQLADHLCHGRYTRQLVFGHSPEEIVGYVCIYDLMAAVEAFTGVEPYLTPLTRIPRKTSVIECMNILRNQRERIALVVDTAREPQRPVGLVTISDLIEELTGEINR